MAEKANSTSAKPKAAAKDPKETTEQATFMDGMPGMEDAREQFDKFKNGMEEVAVFHKENVEAVVESANLASKSAKQLNEENIAFQREAFQGAVENVQSLFTATGFSEAIEAQSNFARESLNAYVNHWTQLGEKSVEASKEVMEPLNARVGAWWKSAEAFRT